MPERQEAPTQAGRGRRPSDTFANRLTLTIRLTGLTIREFAEAAGLDDGSVSNWTRGMRPRDLVDVCQAIADAHDIDRDWLLLGGPLLPARGKPVKRASDITLKYLESPDCPSPCRPTGRSRKGVVTQVVRRPQRINRTQMPTAA